MAMLGMNVEAVRQLSKEMDKAAGDIETILGRLSGKLNSVEWVGSDATSFKGDWQSKHAAQLKAVAQALREAAQRAEKNAAEQEQASNN